MGQPDELPPDIAADCVDEFLVVSMGAMGEWPHPQARIDVVATDGPRWSVRLTSVARVETNPTGDPTATVSGRAADLILVLYSRVPSDRLQIGGDRKCVRRVLDWVKMSTS